MAYGSVWMERISKDEEMQRIAEYAVINQVDESCAEF
jgi:hypothetical protein